MLTSVSFDDMELKGDLLRGVYAYGFERPCPSSLAVTVSLKPSLVLVRLLLSLFLSYKG
jgi:hypothetical protein